MEYLSLKNATFSPNQIVVFKKQGKVIIDIGAIRHINYAKPSLLNYLFASPLLGGGTFPGRLEIYLNDNLLTRRKYSTSLFIIPIKYKEYLQLPEIYKYRFNLH